jgi:DNA-binding GntR family transcriptional regulator
VIEAARSPAKAKPDEQEKLADTAYRTLLSKILSHELPGGTVIQERKLAQAMGVSRTPMRDALARLEGLGLLVRLTDRLLAVRVITLQDYLHSLDVRAMIEPQAAAHAAKTISAADVAALHGELDVLSRHSGDGIEELHWRFDDLLHDTIAQKSGNPILREMIDAMRRYTGRRRPSPHSRRPRHRPAGKGARRDGRSYPQRAQARLGRALSLARPRSNIEPRLPKYAACASGGAVA